LESPAAACVFVWKYIGLSNCNGTVSSAPYHGKE
jgi:hypothetical protein